jgi:two-component system, OmpR family, alkaline phosphatase synthesis response regulator PhoP
MEKNSYKILVVDDEPDILEFITYNLKRESYEVYVAANGQEGIEKAKEINPDLIVLDVMMPVLDGIETCRRLREMPEFKSTFIVFLTARGEEYSEIAGFNAGADDYIAKPIKPRVLISRIHAILRRKDQKDQKTSPSKIQLNDLVIDKESFTVYKAGTKVQMAKKEFELLFLLASKPGKVFTRENILEKVWGDDVLVVDRTIDVHIRKIREKLGDEHISTVKGVGYKFEI